MTEKCKDQESKKHEYKQGGNTIITDKPISPLLFAVFDVYPKDWSRKDISDWNNPCVS